VIVGALATIGLLDHHRDELVLVGIARISHVASFGHADRHQRKFSCGLNSSSTWRRQKLLDTKSRRVQQDPGRKTVADKITPQRRQIQSRITADIVGMSANTVDALLGRVSESSRCEIENLIDELQTLHNKLQNDRSRIRRDIMEYAGLSQQVMQVTTIISDSVKTLPGAPGISR
jgi:hypothetical protein